MDIHSNNMGSETLFFFSKLNPNFNITLSLRQIKPYLPEMTQLQMILISLQLSRSKKINY